MIILSASATSYRFRNIFMLRVYPCERIVNSSLGAFKHSSSFQLVASKKS